MWPADPQAGYRPQHRRVAEAAQLPAIPVPFLSQSVSYAPFTGRCVFMGLTVRNVGAVGGTLDVYAGRDTAGALLTSLSPAVQAVSSYTAPGNGVLLENGIFFFIGSFTVSGALLVIPLWDYPFTPAGD